MTTLDSRAENLEGIVAEHEHELSAAAHISSIPTLMGFKRGVLVFSQAGARPAASLEQLMTVVRELDVDEAIGTDAATRERSA